MSVNILVLGNSGVGKSRICNSIYGRSIFESGSSPSGVTTTVHTVDFVPHLQDRRQHPTLNASYVLFNIPGIREMDPSNVKRNKICVKETLACTQGQPCVFLFVASAEGGRLRDEDIQSCRSIMEAAAIPPKYVSFVVNKIPLEEFGSDEERETYKRQLTSTVRIALGYETPVTFLPFVLSDESPSYRTQVLSCLADAQSFVQTPSGIAATNVVQNETERLQREVERLQQAKKRQEQEVREKLQREAMERERQLVAERQQREAQLREAQQQHQARMRELELQREQQEREQQERQRPSYRSVIPRGWALKGNPNDPNLRRLREMQYGYY